MSLIIKLLEIFYDKQSTRPIRPNRSNALSACRNNLITRLGGAKRNPTFLKPLIFRRFKCNEMFRQQHPRSYTHPTYLFKNLWGSLISSRVVIMLDIVFYNHMMRWKFPHLPSKLRVIASCRSGGAPLWYDKLHMV